MNLKPIETSVFRPRAEGFPAWRGFARSAWLLALILGVLVVGFQSRLSPRPSHPGPARLCFASVAPVKFPMPERQELGQDQSCELDAFSVVPPSPACLFETVPRPVLFLDSGSRCAVPARAPPTALGLL